MKESQVESEAFLKEVEKKKNRERIYSIAKKDEVK